MSSANLQVVKYYVTRTKMPFDNKFLSQNE